jgi:hypothetical protein
MLDAEVRALVVELGGDALQLYEPGVFAGLLGLRLDALALRVV